MKRIVFLTILMSAGTMFRAGAITDSAGNKANTTTETSAGQLGKDEILSPSNVNTSDKSANNMSDSLENAGNPNQIAVFFALLAIVMSCIALWRSFRGAKNGNVKKQEITGSSDKKLQKRIDELESKFSRIEKEKDCWTIKNTSGNYAPMSLFKELNEKIVALQKRGIKPEADPQIDLRREIAELKNYIEEIRRQLQKSAPTLPPAPAPAPAPPPIPAPQLQPAPQHECRVVYFSIPIAQGCEASFNQYSEEKVDDSKFEAELAGNQARFSPLSTSSYDIRFNEFLDIAITVDDSGASRKDAKAFDTVEKGVAEKNGDRWVIRKKAIIRLN